MVAIPVVPRRQIGYTPTSVTPSVSPAGAFTPPTPIDFGPAAREIARQVEEHQAGVDNMALLEADNQLTDLRSTLQQQVLSKQGKDAIASGPAEIDQWRKAITDIGGGLNNRIQNQFKARAQHHWEILDETIANHVRVETQQYDTQTTDAFLKNRLNDALTHYTDPLTVGQSLTESKDVLDNYAHRNGWSPEQLQAKKSDVVSKIHAGVIDRMLTDGNDLTAGTYFNAHKDELNANDQLEVGHALDIGSLRGESQRRADAIVSGGTPSQIEAGNIDLTTRPRVKNADGTISTVRSMSFEENGREILVPTVSDGGKLLTNDEAIALYHKTGKHLGIFSDAASADEYAQQLHQAQEAMLAGQGNGIPIQGQGTATLSGALAQAAKITDPKLREETEGRIRRYFEDQSASDRFDKQQAYAQASAILSRNPDIHAIPPSMMEKLSASEQIELQHLVQQKRNPTRATDPDVYASLLNMAGLNDSTRQQFESLDLRQYYGQLSDKDYNHLLTLQLGERRQTGGALSAEAKRQAAIADRDAKKQKDREAAMQTLRNMGVDIPPTVPGAPLRGANMQLKLSPKGKQVPQTWVDHASKDGNYRRYLEHMGVVFDSIGGTPSIK